MLRAIGLFFVLFASATAVRSETLSLSPEALGLLTPTSGARVLEYSADEYRAEGKIEGCGVSFQYLFRDWAYRDNAPTIAYGSVVYFWVPPKKPYLALRLGINDLTVEQDSVTRERRNPYFAYIQLNGRNMAGREDEILLPKEDKLINILYFEDDKSSLFSEFLFLKNLTVAFNREKGSTDLSHAVVDDHANPEHAKLRECLTEMFQLAQEWWAKHEKK